MKWWMRMATLSAGALMAAGEHWNEQQQYRETEMYHQQLCHHSVVNTSRVQQQHKRKRLRQISANQPFLPLQCNIVTTLCSVFMHSSV